MTNSPPNCCCCCAWGCTSCAALERIPASAAVNTSVELAKENQLGRLSGVVNGLLRQYLRQVEAGEEPLPQIPDPVTHLGIRYSYPRLDCGPVEANKLV